MVNRAGSSEPQTSADRVQLRLAAEADLEAFFQHQLDLEANRMAAFTAKDPTDRQAYFEKWTGVLRDDSVTMKAIVVDDLVVGNVLVHSAFGYPEISYWIDRAYWGQGIATAALSLFLAEVRVRPLVARAAQDNRASIRVLEKCGFSINGHTRGFANGRGEEIDEVIMRLL